MAITCQSPSCDTEFHDAVLDPHEAISNGFVDQIWSYDRPAPDGMGTECLRFCSNECVREWLDSWEDS